jgi:imidazole glycerol-phosphate synthase subunit HisH
VIALIDYRAGNLTSVKKALAAVGAEVFVPSVPSELASVAGIIVPGVGHFGATRALDVEWVGAIRRHVDAGRPLLGICLGMQWLFDTSEEAPDCPGLGILSGRCYRLGARPIVQGSFSNGGSGRPSGRPSDGLKPVAYVETKNALLPDSGIKIPHVGWNSLDITRPDSIVDGVPSGSQVYFTHSYVAPITGDTVANTEHGEPFASIVQRGHVAGVQFHPEKSGEVGLRILRNFLSMTDAR